MAEKELPKSSNQKGEQSRDSFSSPSLSLVLLSPVVRPVATSAAVLATEAIGGVALTGAATILAPITIGVGVGMGLNFLQKEAYRQNGGPPKPQGIKINPKEAAKLLTHSSNNSTSKVLERTPIRDFILSHSQPTSKEENNLGRIGLAKDYVPTKIQQPCLQLPPGMTKVFHDSCEEDRLTLAPSNNYPQKNLIVQNSKNSGLPLTLEKTTAQLQADMEEVEKFLLPYAKRFGMKPSDLLRLFNSAPYQMVLDSSIVVSMDPARAVQNTTKGLFSSYSNTFGYQYFHTVDPRPFNFKEKGKTPISQALYGIDTRVVMQLPPTAFSGMIQLLDKLNKLSNHDPLHSINGLPKDFKDFEKNYRTGGAEYVSTLLHSRITRELFDSDPKAAQKLATEAHDYVQALADAKKSDAFKQTVECQLYMLSIYLRKLLLILPQDHPIIKKFLHQAEESLFEGKPITIQPKRYKEFLKRDFSDGNEPDPFSDDDPKHKNRVYSYNHGRNSVAKDWMNKFVKQYFNQNLDAPAQNRTNSDLLLLDAVTRGHGIYGLVSADEASSTKYTTDQLIAPFKKRELSPVKVDFLGLEPVKPSKVWDFTKKRP